MLCPQERAFYIEFVIMYIKIGLSMIGANDIFGVCERHFFFFFFARLCF